MRIWERLNLCKTFWSGERIVWQLFDRCKEICQTFDYMLWQSEIFFISLFKKVSEDFILSRWKYFYFDFLGWKKKCLMKIFLLQRCWMKFQWSILFCNLLELFAEIIDIELLSNITILFANVIHCDWLQIRPEILSLISRMFARSNNGLTTCLQSLLKRSSLNLL